MSKTPRRRGLSKPRPEGTLKEAEARLVERVGGTVRAADVLVGSQTHVQKCIDPSFSTYELKLSQVRTLERECGDPIVTAFMAAEAGHLLIPIEPLGNARLDLDMARVWEEMALLSKTYVEIMADGQTTRKELSAMKAKALRGARAAMAIFADCEALLKE